MYKAVQTKEKNGKLELSAVPSAWEESGVLYWPTSANATALLNDANSSPQKSGGMWRKYDCTVKRKNLPTLKRATDEVAAMINNVQPTNVPQFKKISTVAELQKFNKELESNPEIAGTLFPYFHSLCNAKSFADKASPGEYALSIWIDHIFTRELFTKCSWSGGCRKKDISKTAFKQFENVISFVKDLARSVDASYTLLQAQNFIKRSLQYSTRRNVTVVKRRSAPKCRRRVLPPLSNKVSEDEDSNEYVDFGDQANDHALSELDHTVNVNILKVENIMESGLYAPFVSSNGGGLEKHNEEIKENHSSAKKSRQVLGLLDNSEPTPKRKRAKKVMLSL